MCLHVVKKNKSRSSLYSCTLYSKFINSIGIQRLVEHVENGAPIGSNGRNPEDEGDVYMDNIPPS